MAIPGQPAFAIALDTSSIVTQCSTPKDARALPPGAIVGDRHGGLTFADHVAAVLEARSYGGWQEVEARAGERWTLIVLNR